MMTSDLYALPAPELLTLQQAILYFADPINCLAYMVRRRWHGGPVACPTCGSTAVTFLPSRSLFQCKARHARRQFSVKVGTIFEDSAISLGKWLVVTWMLMNCRNGVSSYEVARTIGITQKSAWFMLHRLREAMKLEHLLLTGTVEADETYIGGRIKNKHARAKKQLPYRDKTPVFGVVERGGLVVARVVPTAKAEHVLPVIEASVSKQDALLVTDNYPIYNRLRARGFTHEIINHTQNFFVRAGLNGARIHTNTIENFWACLKRMLAGTYVAVTPAHLDAYVTEQMMRFNCRFKFVTEEMRFAKVLDGTTGRRLTYRQLTAKSQAAV